MNVLFSTGHPAQIHNFRLVREQLLRDGHQVFWLATNKDISVQLLSIYHIPYVLLDRPGKTIKSKILVLLKNVRTAMRFLKKNKVKIIVSRGDPYTSIAGFILRIPHVTFNDTENAATVGKHFAKLVTEVFVPQCFRATLRNDQIRFAGNIELFYLHKSKYTPLPPYELLGISAGEKYALVRFVKWNAYHDVDLAGGFTSSYKTELVRRLSKKLRVFVSSEDVLPEDLESYRIHIPLERMHDVLAGAELIIGESATMASESVVLGTPAIYVDEVGRGYTDEEANEGLLYMFRPNQQNEAILKAEEIVSSDFDNTTFQEKQQKFLAKKINPTDWLVWYIENYPNSKKIMRENPDYQYNFR